VRSRICRGESPQHPAPDTLHPTPDTPHPTPDTLHPTPYTLHPTPYTLHPTPFLDRVACVERLQETLADFFEQRFRESIFFAPVFWCRVYGLGLRFQTDGICALVQLWGVHSVELILRSGLRVEVFLVYGLVAPGGIRWIALEWALSSE